MVNYKNGKIYKIFNTIDDNIYVGSTCDTLINRWRGHKSAENRGSNMKLYKHVKKLGGWIHFHIVLIKDCPCENKKELFKNEGDITKELNASLNYVVIGRTQKEYGKIYKKNNLDKTRERDRKNKDRINLLRRINRAKNKERDKDEINRKYREWYAKNKKDILERTKDRREKYYIDNKLKIIEQSKNRYNLIKNNI